LHNQLKFSDAPEYLRGNTAGTEELEQYSTGHDFNECLAFSHAAEDMPFWEECYKKAFPTFINMKSNRHNMKYQRLGVDRIVTIGPEEKRIYIDEKVRRAWYGDILLEYYSVYNARQQAPGWVCKPLFCDYIAYAVLPIKKCFLLPTIQLQTAWRKNGEYWKKTYKLIEAQQKHRQYVTKCVAIPVNELYKEVGQCLRVDIDD